MADDVVAHRVVRGHRPIRRAFLVAGLDEDREALGRGPGRVEDVPLEQDPARVLRLVEILDGPVHCSPRDRLDETVAADLDVGRNKVRDARVGTAEHDVLAGSFQMVVRDLERPRPRPARDGLRVRAHLFPIRDVGIDHRRGCAVEGDASPAADVGITVDVATIDDDVVRELGEAGLRARTQANQAAGERAGRGSELNPDEAVVVGAILRHEGGNRAARGNDGGHGTHVCRRHTIARRRKCTARPDIDPRSAGSLVGQRERAGECGTRLQHDRIAGLGAVDGGLKIAARVYRDCVASGWRIRRVEEYARELGKRCVCQAGELCDRQAEQERNHQLHGVKRFAEEH